MKAIMLSVRPEWVAKILNGEKTIEVRKNCPSVFKHLKPYESAKLDVYIYCTKDKKGIFKERHNGYTLLNQNKWIQSEMNGKVVAKFTLNKVEEVIYDNIPFSQNYFTPSITNAKKFLERTCLEWYDLYKYLGENNGYAWHIDDLKIFGKPKELSEFELPCPVSACFDCKYVHKTICGLPFGCGKPRLTNVPQSWCYVEGEEER